MLSNERLYLGLKALGYVAWHDKVIEDWRDPEKVQVKADEVDQMLRRARESKERESARRRGRHGWRPHLIDRHMAKMNFDPWIERFKLTPLQGTALIHLGRSPALRKVSRYQVTWLIDGVAFRGATLEALRKRFFAEHRREPERYKISPVGIAALEWLAPLPENQERTK